MRNTTVINFFGAPGSGKSTLSSGLFCLLKQQAKYSAELVTEYAKELTWEDRKQSLGDQLYISAKQNHRLQRLLSQVEIIITDSPLLQGLIYTPEGYYPSYSLLIPEIFKGYKNINFLVHRSKRYCPIGRSQTEEESGVLHRKIESLLRQHEVPYTSVETSVPIAELLTLLPELPTRTTTRTI